MFNERDTDAVVQFVRHIGLGLVRATVSEDAFLPGLALRGGVIVLDDTRLRSPGDILHEAGHLAVMAPVRRGQCDGRLVPDGGEELGAIAWSYAAALQVGLAPAALFHDEGYRGDGVALRDNFSQGRYLGVPYLQWLGMSLEPEAAARQGLRPYPHMLRWLCERHPVA